MNSVNYIERLVSQDNNYILLIPTLILISIILIPDLSFIGTESIIICFLIWIGPIFSKFQRLDKRSRDVIVSAFIYFIIIFFYKFLGISLATWDIAAGYFGYLFAITISLISIQIFNDRVLKIIEFTFIVVTIAGIIYVTKQGLYNLTFMDVEEAISQENAAYSSLIMLFSGICFIAILNYQNKKYKIVYAIALILAINVNLSILQRGTNVIFTFAMIFLILYFRKIKERNFSKRIILIFLVCGVIYFTGAIIPILEMFINLIPSERVASRLESIIIFFQTKDAMEAGTSFTTRTQLAEQSLDTFFSSLSNFLFGIGDSRGFSQKIGDHSEIIDASARYGIIGLAIIVNIFYSQYRYLKCLIRNNIAVRFEILVVYFMYLLRNINGNTMTTPVAFLIFLYLPIVIYFSTKKQV